MDLGALAVWLRQPANLVALAQVAAALITAAATIALWRVTRILAKETETLAQLTASPFVVCYLESSGASPNAMNLVLINTGNATAFDIDATITPALPDPRGNPPDSEETRFTASLLPPGKTLSYAGVQSHKLMDHKFKAHVIWTTVPGSRDAKTLSYEFDAKDGHRSGWRTKGMHEIAEALEKIQQQR